MNLAYKKILGKFTKVLGFGKTPAPCWEKFPKNIVFFLERTLTFLIITLTHFLEDVLVSIVNLLNLHNYFSKLDLKYSQWRASEQVSLLRRPTIFKKKSIYLFWLDPQGDNRTVRINLLRYVHLILCNNISCFLIAQNVSVFYSFSSAKLFWKKLTNQCWSHYNFFYKI